MCHAESTHIEAAVVELSPRPSTHELIGGGVPGHRREGVLLRVSHLQVQLLRLWTYIHKQCYYFHVKHCLQTTPADTYTVINNSVDFSKIISVSVYIYFHNM